MGNFPCGKFEQLKKTTHAHKKVEFKRKEFKTIINPKLHNVTLLYKDQSINYDIKSKYQLLLDVYVKVNNTNYKTPPSIIITLPYDEPYVKPITFKKTFSHDCMEYEFRENSDTLKKYFNNSEENYVCWSGVELNTILRDKENEITKKYMNYYNSVNENKFNNPNDFYNEIKKTKISKCRYVKIQDLKIKITPESYNDMSVRFRFITYKRCELDETLGDINMLGN